MGLTGRRGVRRHITLTAEEEARLVTAAKKDRASSLSQWIATTCLRRADELGIPEEVPLPKKRRAGRPNAGGE